MNEACQSKRGKAGKLHAVLSAACVSGDGGVVILAIHRLFACARVDCGVLLTGEVRSFLLNHSGSLGVCLTSLYHVQGSTFLDYGRAIFTSDIDRYVVYIICIVERKDAVFRTVPCENHRRGGGNIELAQRGADEEVSAGHHPERLHESGPNLCGSTAGG